MQLFWILTRRSAWTPADARFYILRGLAKRDLEEYFAAIIDFDEAIRLVPDYAPAYVLRGQIKAFPLERHEAAILDFDEAIRLNPDDADTYYYRGRAKGILGRVWEEKQDLRTALKLAELTGDDELIAEIESWIREFH